MARCRAFRSRRSINVYQAFYATTNGIIAFRGKVPAGQDRYRRARLTAARFPKETWRSSTPTSRTGCYPTWRDPYRR